MGDVKPIIFIVDDDPSARRGLTRLVRAAGLRVEPFDSAAAFLASEHRHGPGCIVLDVKMAGMTGPELQDQLAKEECCLPIIFLSAHADVPTAAQTMKKGAADFLTKPVDREDLLAAVRTALEKNAQQREQRAEAAAISGQIKLLTPREYEVMTLVIAGQLNKHIADALDISEETVKIHRGNMMRKLGVISVAELVGLCAKARVDPAGGHP